MIEYGFRQKAAVGIVAVVIAVAILVAGSPASAAGGQGAAAQANANPGVIPNRGAQYGDLAIKWWQWAYSFPALEVPFFNTGGPVDVSVGQSGHVWFLAGANSGPATRTADVPVGTQLFFPMANAINDYPCPPQFGFEPAPGESLEHFLQRTGNDFLGTITDLFAEIDGKPLANLGSYRNTSDIFTFTADPAIASIFDPCVTGTPQPGVAIGYWLLLAPLPPGVHTLHFGAPSWGQDVTYVLTVKPGRRH